MGVLKCPWILVSLLLIPGLSLCSLLSFWLHHSSHCWQFFPLASALVLFYVALVALYALLPAPPIIFLLLISPNRLRFRIAKDSTSAGLCADMCYEIHPRYEFCCHFGTITHRCCPNPLECEQWTSRVEVIHDFCPVCHGKW